MQSCAVRMQNFRTGGFEPCLRLVSKKTPIRAVNSSPKTFTLPVSRFLFRQCVNQCDVLCAQRRAAGAATSFRDWVIIDRFDFQRMIFG